MAKELVSRQPDMDMDTLPEPPELLQYISQGLLVVTPDRNIIFWNDRFCDLFELPDSHLQRGMALQRLTDFLTARGDLALAKADPAMRANVETFQDHQSFELQLANGRVLDIRREPTPSGSIITTYTDVTESKRASAALSQSQTRYRELVEGSIQGIMIIQDFRPIFANERYAAMVGYTVDEVLALGSAFELVPESDRAPARERLKMRLSGGGIPAEVEYQLRRKDGAFLWVAGHSAYIEWDGQPAVQTTVVDITERRQIDQMKEQFLAATSHELKTPLTAIAAAFGYLSDTGDNLDADQKGLLAIGESNAKRMERLIDTVLDYGAIQSNAFSLNMSEIVLAQAIDNVVSDYNAARRTDDPVLVVDGVDVGFAVSGDAQALGRALRHLIDNAADFAPPETDVRLVVSRPEQATVRISVIDQGVGIPPGVGDRVFDRFWQSSAGGRRSHSGVGLGLTLAKEIIAMHAGEIGYRRDLSVGTEFFVNLPVLSAAETA